MAILEWEQATCIDFVEVSTGYSGPHLKIQRHADDCRSFIGMVSTTGQDFYISEDCEGQVRWLTKVPVLEIPSYAWPSMTNRWPQIHCLTHQQHGELLHLLGYAIGFWPEETRSDRNHYVQINNDNVLATVVDNFPLNSDNNYSVPFDYCSIMFHHERVQAIYISVCSRYVWCHIDFQYVFVVRIYSKIPPFLRLSRIMAE